MTGHPDIGQGAAIFGTSGPVLGADEAAFFRDYDPFGFIIFARNVDNPDQLRRLTGDLRDAVGRDAVILVDQEGGRVQRLGAPHWTEWLPPLDEVARVTATGGDAGRSMWLRYRIIADELRAVGIDGNCAPCADLVWPQTHPFLKNRCLGDRAEDVAHLAGMVARAHLAGGVLPVVKHLPGHGRANADTHHQLPHVQAPLAELHATDFAPFAALAHLPMAMTAHIVFSAIDDAAPATQSAAMIDVIRRDIGFDGLLMTDDLNMQALSGDLRVRTARAMAAGCDIALHCKGDLAEMQAVAAAAGAMGPAARARAAAALRARHVPQAADIAALRAEHAALVAGGAHV